MSRGRPSDYSPETASEICTRIRLGDTIRKIAADDAMPGERTIYQWLAAHDDFAQQYTRAREESAHVAADAVAEVAEEVRRGELEPDRGRVVIDALKWSAGKRKPKVYSDKIQIGGDPDTPLIVTIAAAAESARGKLAKLGINSADDLRQITDESAPGSE